MLECLFFCSCWLSIEGYFIWAFVGPVLLVCLVSLPLFPRLAHKLLEFCAIRLVSPDFQLILLARFKEGIATIQSPRDGVCSS